MRLFVALDLPADARAALAAWCEAAAPAGVRRVPADNLHVTLAFLGSRSQEEAAAAGALLAGVVGPLGGSCGPPGRCGCRRAGPACCPSRSLRTTRWPRCRPISSRGSSAAIAFEPERRRFRPHVTVGRVARGTPIDARQALAPDVPPLAFAAPAVTLYRSHTGAGGARYEPLVRAELG